jgi:uncharacterized delta-60 repeat protein
MSAGALDPSFNGGLVSGPIGAWYSTTGFTMQTQSYAHVPVVVYPNTGQHFVPSVPAWDATDNKILAGGFKLDPVTHYQDFAIARYNSDGTPDPAFGSGGVAYTSVGVSSSDLFALAIQNDRKIVAVGAAAYQRLGNGKNTTDDEAIAVVRFNVDGSLDKTFNHTGTVVINVSAPSKTSTGVDDATTVAIDSSGKIIVGGLSGASHYGNFTLVRLDSDGSVDPTFGSGGVVVTPNIGNTWNSADGLTIQPDGKILLAGSSVGFAVARYNVNVPGKADGSLDTSFGTNGIVGLTNPTSYSFGAAYGVLVQNASSGTIVLAGNSQDSTGGQHVTLARLSSTGQFPDSSASFGGASTGFYVNSNVSFAFSLIQAHNGDLLTGGTYPSSPTENGGLFGLSAFLPNGTPDVSFGNNGTFAVAGPSGTYARGRGTALQSDSKIVLAGITATSSSSTDYTLALARFLPPATFSANPNPVAAGSSVTLFVTSNIMSPASTITGVTFAYVDNFNTTVVLSAIQTSPGIWTYSAASGLGLTKGVYTITARATDNNGVLSDPVSISFTVI